MSESQVGQVKKKKYKKVSNELNSTVSVIKGQFEDKSISFKEEISSIHQVSRSVSSHLETSSLSKNILQLSTTQMSGKQEVTNLYHDDDFVDLKGEFEDKELIKNLKKYIKKAFPAKGIELFSGRRRPTLKFQYQDTSKNGQLVVRSLGDLLKANKQLGDREYQTIKKIFDHLYCRLNQRDRKIVPLLQRLAERRRVQLRIVDGKSGIPLLYYQYDENSINFTLFDLQMRMFQFSTEIVSECKFDGSMLKAWNGFIENIESRREKNEKRYDQFGEMEIQSDEEAHQMANINEKEILKKIETILKTDLTDYEDELQEMDASCRELQGKNDDRDKPQLQRLADQVYQLHHNIDNFKEVMKFVDTQLKRKKYIQPFKLKNLLKTLIIAEKQLKSRLPIVARKQQIFNLLNKQDLIILEGETGSGKSTQLPQMMCEYFKIFEEEFDKTLPVLITQPRRLATRTVAERVAFEMQESIGGFVDYATSAHKQVSKLAKIIFKLDSVVLDELTVDRALSRYSCLIIDQAHERTISIDVILGLIKQLQQIRKGFKVIVTSASLDGKLFSDYFKVKVFKVSGRLFPVDVIYHPLSHQSDLVKKVQITLKKQILLNNSELRDQYKGDVLVFCSGVDDINILCTIFEKYLNQRVFRVFALHGKIAVAEQREVFLATKEHKIIFASRIAETSITINGVKVVIDPGVDRELVYDQRFRVSSRKLINISQSSAKQRAGRAGRTSRGFCFRLYSESELNKFRVNKTPQIDNMALDTLVLRLKSLGVDNIFTFPYVKVPDRAALQQSLQTLQMIGGLSAKTQITTVGRLLLRLHVQPFLGRSIVEALICDYIVKQTNFIASEGSFRSWQKRELQWLRGIRNFVIEILCMVINSSNLFFGNINLRDRIEQIKYANFSNEKGDFFFLSNIYSGFYQLKKDRNALNHWLQRNYLNKKTLFQTQELIEEINEIIKNFKLDIKDPSITYLIDTIKLKLTYCKSVDDVIVSCMITSFCVNLCLYSNNPRVGYTLVLQKKPVIIYGTSTLAQQGLTPKWIVCYDLKTNDKGTTYCTIANEVNFDFLKKTVQQFVFRRLNLKQAETMNPFYHQIELKLPTSVLSEIAEDYLNKDNHNTMLLRNVTLDIESERNTLYVLYSRELRLKDIFQGDNFSNMQISDIIHGYVQQKWFAKKNEKFVSNVVSNIFVEFKDGFMVQGLTFADFEIEFVVMGQKFVLNQVRNNLDGVNAYPFGQTLKIVTYSAQDEQQVKKLLDDYQLKYDCHKRERKEQTLMGQIYMRFYTGKLKGQPLILFYGRDNPSKVEQMYKILDQFQRNQRESQRTKGSVESLRYLKLLLDCKFRLSYKKTTIKCYNLTVDSFQLRQAIENLIIVGILPFQFEKPYSIREFREENQVLRMRSEKEWAQEIANVLKKNQLEGLTVSVKGEHRHQDDPEARNAQRLRKDELTAMITSKSLQSIDDMVKKLDGRENVIGEGKLHFRYNFKQLIIKVNKRTFKTLFDQFDWFKKRHQASANVKIQYFERTFGKVVSVFINCRSPIRENLLKPTEEIKDLFSPFLKRMSVAQFNFMYNTEQGEIEMEKIQEDFSYKVYFGFIKKNHYLKIYCLQEVFEELSERIDKIFQRHQVFVKNISYRGKGLAKVEEVLGGLIRQNEESLKKSKASKLVLYYSIVFKRRQVQIYGDLQSLKKAQIQISKLDSIQIGSCSLCCKNSEKPFRLTLCEHEFCEKCLADYIDQVRKEEDDKSGITQNSEESIPLVCPDQKCQKKINASDLKALLSTEQFQSLSMRRLRDYVKNHKQYFFCPTASCEQIFQVKKISQRSNFQCVMCGRWFCSSCRQPHQYFTCAEWQLKLKKGELSRFGFRRCNCGYILQKENKDKLIRCRNCKQYLCWSCDKSWAREKFCLDHIKTCKK